MSEPALGGRVNTAASLAVARRAPANPDPSHLPITAQLEPPLLRISLRISLIPATAWPGLGLITIVTCTRHASTCARHASVTKNNSRFLRQEHTDGCPGAHRHAPGACRRCHTADRTNRRDRGLPGSGGSRGTLLPRPYAADRGHVRPTGSCLRVFHLWVLALPQPRDGGRGSAARRAAARARACDGDRGQNLGTRPALPGDAHREGAQRRGSLWRCALAGEAAALRPPAPAHRPQRAHRRRLRRGVGAPSMALL